MKLPTPALITLAASLLLPATALAGRTCYPGVYVLVARGSLEPPGEGQLGVIAGLVTGEIPGSYSYGVAYPAVLTQYNDSVALGVESMTQELEDYVDACPDSAVGLMGYSQGAQVLGDVLCGWEAPGRFNRSKPVSDKYGNQVAFALQFGDPTFVAHEPYDAGTSTKSGEFPRPHIDVRQCLRYKDRLRSWCDQNDIVCAGGDSLAVHLSYTETYALQAAQYAVTTYLKYRADPPHLRGGGIGGGNGGNPKHPSDPGKHGGNGASGEAHSHSKHNDGIRQSQISLLGIVLTGFAALAILM